jgi:phenylacetate-CoA ligase
MQATSHEDRRACESLDRDALAGHQLARLNALLDAILPAYPEVRARLAHLPRPLRSLDDLALAPFMFKEGLIASASFGGRPGGKSPTGRPYVRYHQTSGTRGRPMPVLDTAEDWQWWINGWQFVLDAAGITADDRLLLAFSFGPFIGFWAAFEAGCQRGCLVIPGGGMNTEARLAMIRASQATALFCTPSYALHMAEVAVALQIVPAELGIRKVVLAGEPGGSIPATRARIESAWGARVTDHAGATEVGPWGYGDRDARGLHILETEFIAEFLSIEDGKPATEGELSELVLTNLGRYGNPLIRYRTGDLVRPVWRHGQANRFVLLEGGVLGRADDMTVVRGVNIFPSAIEQIVRSFPEVVEYRATIERTGAMDQMRVEIEDRLDDPRRVSSELQLRLGLKVEVRAVPPGTLPRFDGKGKRFVDLR